VGGGDIGKGWNRVYIVVMLHTHVSKSKMRLVETILSLGGRRIKDSDRGGN
jgi:hypothetical protein